LIIGLRGGEFEGQDMQDRYGITKYEPPIRQVQLSSGRKIKYTDNPNFGVYYKFPNLKNVPGMFNEDDNVQITRKIHGTNARYGYVLKRKLSIIDRIKIFFGDKFAKYEFVYGSHNVEKGSDSQGYYDTNVWLEAMNKYDIKNKLKEFAKAFILNDTDLVIGSGVVLYGEIYGPGIQKGYDYELNDIKFAGFDLVVNGEYQTPINAQIFITHYLELPHVPVLYNGPWSQKVQDSLVLNNFIGVGRVPHEGVIIKHETGLRKLVAKVINPDYLIYAEKHNVGDSH
jgi:RNA ligase (TIGR02306 family)